MTLKIRGAHQKLNLGVLLVVFNRPETTAQVFQKIRDVRPPRLYISADGPRPGNSDDVEKCRSVREIVNKIDWPCHSEKLFHNHNLGCGRAVSSAISWFFQNEQEGLILEDDCLPEESFFFFCQELLEKYRHEQRVMHINGNTFNYQLKENILNSNNLSYSFTTFPQVWGWASWKRAWNKYDFEMRDWPIEKKKFMLLPRFQNPGNYFQKALHFDSVYQGHIDTWDFQWQYTVLKNDGLAIVPRVNLISNIGYGEDSTHLKQFDCQRHRLPTRAIPFPLRHPDRLWKDKAIDRHYARHMNMNFRARSIIKYLYWYFKPMQHKRALLT